MTAATGGASATCRGPLLVLYLWYSVNGTGTELGPSKAQGAGAKESCPVTTCLEYGMKFLFSWETRLFLTIPV